MQVNQRDKSINGSQELFSQKASAHGESDDQEEVVQTIPTATRGSCGDLPATNSQASTSGSACSKAQQGNAIQLNCKSIELQRRGRNCKGVVVRKGNCKGVVVIARAWSYARAIARAWS